MKLYSFEHSATSIKVKMALYELGYPFENIEVNLFEGEQSQTEFLKLNSLGKVPVLIDGEVILKESNAILQYLGRKPGSQFWPRELGREATALQWLFFESLHMAKTFSEICFSEITLPQLRGVHATPESLTAAKEDASWALKHLDLHFANHPFVLGNEFTLVDCCFVSSLANLKSTSLDQRNDFPHVTAYREKIMRRASWKKADGHLIQEAGTFR